MKISEYQISLRKMNVYVLLTTDEVMAGFCGSGIFMIPDYPKITGIGFFSVRTQSKNGTLVSEEIFR